MAKRTRCPDCGRKTVFLAMGSEQAVGGSFCTDRHYCSRRDCHFMFYHHSGSPMDAKNMERMQRVSAMKRLSWLLMPIPVLAASLVGVVTAIGITMRRHYAPAVAFVVVSPALALVVGYALWTLVRFGLPVEWRLSSPRWDTWLCARGSHRCVTCSRGCCAVCVRCDAPASESAPPRSASK